MRNVLLPLLALFCVLCFNASANGPGNSELQARMLINLLDYIAKDYSLAVQDGEVINAFEYNEMQEFSAEAERFFLLVAEKDSTVDVETYLPGFKNIQRLVDTRAHPDSVAYHARNLKKQMIAFDLINTAPVEWPRMKKGERLFRKNCASCHAENGNGKGPAAAGLEPAPTDLTDIPTMEALSPLQAYNTILLGIPGTSMRSFAELDDDELWSLAFYVNSLPYASIEKPQKSSQIPLQDVASLSDLELQEKYGHVPGFDLKAIRVGRIENVNGDEDSLRHPLDLAAEYLYNSLDHYREGDHLMASSFALKAYLDGVEPVEHRIMASHNKLVVALELSFMAVREGIQEKLPAVELEHRVEEAIVYVEEAKALVINQKPSMGFTAFLTTSILLREGLEAFLIIIAIISILKSLNAHRAIRFIHIGWIAAVLVGIAGWFFTDYLLAWGAQQRELMEGAIALVAVVTLLYIGFWLHGKTEASRWKSFIETKVKALLNDQNRVGLAVFAFIVVFREAFESVIFMSSLSIDGQPESQTGILVGIGVSAILLTLVAWGMLVFMRRMPIRQLFLFSSFIILLLAFILAGDGVHALQEGGYLDVSSFPFNLRASLLGIYPTYESLLVQLMVLLAVALLLGFNKFRRRNA